MSTSSAVAAVTARRVVPVITIADSRDAVPLGQSLKAGGLPVAEVTLRTPAGLEALRLMAQDPDLLVGAGTVTNAWQVDSACAAGAAFIVSPGVRPDLVRHCQSVGVPVFPGVLTPTEVMTALDCGIETVKFFPAGQFGGVQTIAALAAPFPGLKFIPTGGITNATAADYLAHPAVAAIGGSWMVANSLLADKSFDEITRLSAAAVHTCADRAQPGPETG